MSTPINFYRSDFSASESKNSGAMKKIMSNEKVAKILGDSSKQKKFYEVLKKNSGSNHALQKTLGELRAEKGDGINSDAANAIGRELIKSGRRFIMPERTKNSIEQKRSPYVSASSVDRMQSQRVQSMSRPTTGSQLSQSLIKRNSGLIGSGLIKPSR